MVEAVRVGTVFAHDHKVFQRWRSRKPARKGKAERGLTGAALEAAVMNIARIFPENVVRGGAA